MNIKVNAVKFKADSKLVDFVKAKINKLSQFTDQIVGAEVFFKLENTQLDENKIVEIKLEVAGNDLFAKKQGKTFEEATDEVVEALTKQVKKHKDKIRGK